MLVTWMAWIGKQGQDYAIFTQELLLDVILG